MHNPVGPWIEANALYIDQSEIRTRLSEVSSAPLVLFDVGLGAATNAIAAIRAASKAMRPLHIYSYENNLALLSFVLGKLPFFPHLDGMEGAMRAILEAHHWTSPCGRIVWNLREGDFLEKVVTESVRPDLIYYDPYSPSVNQEMWTTSVFKLLKNILAGGSTSLYTYSCATPVRAALLMAGFYVGHGQSTGLKQETTIASTHLADLKNPLGDRWRERWERSHTKYTYDKDSPQGTTLSELLARHPQFAALTVWRPSAGSP